MDIERLWQLFSDGDTNVWEALYHGIERRDLGQMMIKRVQNWPVGPLRALATDILSGDFRLIPAGRFVMGSPESERGRDIREVQHHIELSCPFLLKTTPVTQHEWRALMHNNPSRFSSNDGNCPVETVSWFDALAYCNALSEKEGLRPCYDLSSCTGTAYYKGPENIECDFSSSGYRLPTEAEWEYAARAGTTTAFYNGEITTPRGKDSNLDQIAWYRENSDGTTHPIKEKLPNAWGLYDMLGNVYEWCWDWHGVYPSTPQRDPRGPSRGSERVVRGGSSHYSAWEARAANRLYFSPNARYKQVGLRCARANF